MAQEMVNRLLAAVKVAADGTVLARSGNVRDIVHVANSGIYLVNLTEGIGAAEFATDTAIDDDPGDVMVRPLAADQFEVSTQNITAGGTLTDFPWNLCIHRLSSTNGT